MNSCWIWSSDVSCVERSRSLTTELDSWLISTAASFSGSPGFDFRVWCLSRQLLGQYVHIEMCHTFASFHPNLPFVCDAILAAGKASLRNSVRSILLCTILLLVSVMLMK